jgi:pimeloyl-ACP methyl ester carboxylesterase
MRSRFSAGLVAAAFLLAPIQPAVAAQPAAAASAAPTRFSVTVIGEGPDVILIPGLASSASVWTPTVERLKSRYRLHVIQVAGFAGVPARANASGPVLAPLVEQIHGYIAASKLSRPAIIGHSLGGLSALMLAANHGDEVGKIMIVDSLPWFGMFFGPTATMEAVAVRGAQLRDAMIAGGQAKYEASVPQSMATLVLSKGPEAQAAIAAGKASDFDVTARAMYDDLTTDMRPRLAGITTPVTMLYPWDASSGIPQLAFDQLYTGAYAPLPNKTIKRIDGAYHFIMIDQPKAFADAVDAFLNG